jgi:catechol 2,3-dioxygenase-like lactoylglutathione lyase family enzyme
MPRLNHLAIMCQDPERLKQFYARWFGFEELNRTQEGTVYITDGYFNVALMKRGAADLAEEDQRPGLHHLGFQIESIEEVRKRLQEFDQSMQVTERPKGGYAEYRIIDPEGIALDLSEEGWGTKGEMRVPGIRHIATANKDSQRKFAFYSQVLGMRDAGRSEDEVDEHIAMSLGGTPGPELRERARVGSAHSGTQGTGTRFAGDGFVNYALLGPRPTEPRPGVNHFGLLAREPHELMLRIAEEDFIRLDQRPPDRFAEYRLWDPEGNAIDLSMHKGYKVDVAKTDRIED